jgi:type III secretion system chaperone SycN
MNWVNDTLADFGRRLGIASLGFGEHGVARLALPSGGWIAVEPVRRGEVDEVLVYMGQPLGFDAPKRLRQALEKAHFSDAGALPVQLASRGKGPDTVLVALTRLPARGFTPQALDHALDTLTRWLEALPR